MPETCAHCGLPTRRAPRDAEDGSPVFCCFGCRMAWELVRPGGDEGTPAPVTAAFLRLGLGLFLALNLMVFNWLAYSRELFGPSVESAQYRSLAELFAYLQLFLATAILVLLGAPLFLDAADALRRRRRADAALLICLAVGAAFALSVANTLRGAGSLYFDTVASVLVLVTLGRYLEAAARRKANLAATDLLASAPRAVQVRETGGKTAERAVADLAVGDVVLARPGEALAVDGRVVEGEALVETSSLTGESAPRSVSPGARVMAGYHDLDGHLWIEATRVGPERTLARLQEMLERARATRPRVQLQADRVAAFFVPAVLTIAAAVLMRHALAGSAARGLLDATSVLLISCPCALGLAAPLATSTALRRAAARGVLVDSAATLERLAVARTAIFDKTGTLTEIAETVSAVGTDETMSANEALALAAALETASRHPIARAFVAEAESRGLSLPAVESTRTLPGRGVAGRVRGRELELGNGLLLADGESDDDELVLLEDGRLRARFQVDERIRDDAVSTLTALRERLQVVVLSGDRRRRAEALADRLDLERLGIEVEAELLPAGKVDRLRALRESSRGAILAVGDGVNDAPLLAAADIGVSVASATDLSARAGNVHLVADRLDLLPRLLELSNDAVRRIGLNLAFAFAYNAIGIGLAAAGWLSPVFAASSMAASGLAVVAISRGAGERAMREDPRLSSKADATRPQPLTAHG